MKRKIVIIIVVFACICMGYYVGNKKKKEGNEIMRKYTIEEKRFLKNNFEEVVKNNNHVIRELHAKKICDKPDEICEEYFYLQDYYKFALEAFLYKKLSIESLQNEIDQYKNEIRVLKTFEDRLIYRFQIEAEQKITPLTLMNNMAIERLADEQVNILKEKYKLQVIDDELLEMIEQTYKMVVKQKEDLNDTVWVSYLNPVPANFVQNNGLAFLFIFETKQMNNDEARNMSLLIRKLLSERSGAYSKILNIPVKIVIQ